MEATGVSAIGITKASKKKVYPEMDAAYRENYIEAATAAAIRNVNMYESYQKGDISYDKLATIWGLSRERIRQIIGEIRANMIKQQS